MANSTSIEHVQDAESKAKSILDEAEKEKAAKILKANEKAAKIIAEAEIKAKEIKAESLKKVEEEVAKSREGGLAEARELAKRIEKTKIGKEKIKRIGSRAAKEIVG